MLRKIFFSLSIFGLLAFGFSSDVFAQVSAENKKIYDEYMDTKKDLSICGTFNSWSDGKTDTFLKIKDLNFAPIGDEASLESVRSMIGDFGGEAPPASSSQMLTYFDTNTELYNAALNNLFACALVNSKAHIYSNIEAAKGGFHFLSESSFQNYMSALKQKNNEDATHYKCRAMGTESDKGISRQDMSNRLINTSSYLTCRYLSYTRYVKNVANQEGALIDNIQNTNELVGTRQMLESRIAAAPNLAIQTISSTFDSYLSFETAYELHIYLLLIRDSYVIMRQRLDDALAPFSQFIYKAHNVTAPGR